MDIIDICKQAHEQIKKMGIEHKCHCGQTFPDVYALEYHAYREHDYSSHYP